MRWNIFYFASIVTAAFYASSGAAEDPLRKIDPAQPVGAIVLDSTVHTGGVLSPHANDQRIVRWLMVDNRGIAECAHSAAERSTNAAVKQFAADMAKEHDDFMGTFGVKKDEPAARNDENKSTANATLLRDDGQSRAGAIIYTPTDFVAVKEEVCKSMKKIAEKEMNALSGAEFDRAFMAHMVFGHEALIASIDALDDTASADLKPQLVKMHEMVHHHLTRARELQGQLQVNTTAARPESNEVK